MKRFTIILLLVIVAMGVWGQITITEVKPPQEELLRDTTMYNGEQWINVLIIDNQRKSYLLNFLNQQTNVCSITLGNNELEAKESIQRLYDLCEGGQKNKEYKIDNLYSVWCMDSMLKIKEYQPCYIDHSVLKNMLSVNSIQYGKSINGSPLGHGLTGGNIWSMNGRYLVGSLPSPSSKFNQEGKVVVFITVDKDGNVISARAGQGTTISDEATRQLAVKAALKATFNKVDYPSATMGTITYNFKFQ